MSFRRDELPELLLHTSQRGQNPNAGETTAALRTNPDVTLSPQMLARLNGACRPRHRSIRLVGSATIRHKQKTSRVGKQGVSRASREECARRIVVQWPIRLEERYHGQELIASCVLQVERNFFGVTCRHIAIRNASAVMTKAIAPPSPPYLILSSSNPILPDIPPFSPTIVLRPLNHPPPARTRHQAPRIQHMTPLERQRKRLSLGIRQHQRMRERIQR